MATFLRGLNYPSDYYATLAPTLQKVAASLLVLTRTSELFTPTMLRQLLGRDYPNTEPATLSAQVQPHLRTLRQINAIALLNLRQKRNRPHRVSNRALLEEVSNSADWIAPLNTMGEAIPDADIDGVDEQSAISGDDTTNQFIELERRIVTLEEAVAKLAEKLNLVAEVISS
mgnify:CR=1 FL=1